MNPAGHEGGLLDAFATLADTLVADFDVIDLLQTLVDTCGGLLDVTAAGLLLADPDTEQLDVVASTSEASRIVETMQIGAVAGPCIESYHQSSVVSVPDIAATWNRWPAFSQSALDQGFRSVYAIPMRLRSNTIGALNLFRAEVGEPSTDDLRAAQALADVATIGVLHARTVRASDVLREQLQQALNSRIVIEQAKGVLAHMHEIDMDAAFGVIRGFARANQRSIVDVAQALVDRTLII